MPCSEVCHVGLQLFTLGPWVYWFLINGGSQPGGQDDTALMPVFDLLNHDIRQEVCSAYPAVSYLHCC